MEYSRTIALLRAVVRFKHAAGKVLGGVNHHIYRSVYMTIASECIGGSR